MSSLLREPPLLGKGISLKKAVPEKSDAGFLFPVASQQGFFVKTA
jgi:hypothetical protein